MARTLARLGALLGALLIVMTSTTSIAAAGTKPPAPYPKHLVERDTIIGVDKKTGEYCDTQDPDLKKRESCRAARDCEEMPSGSLCVGEGQYDPKENRKYEINELKRWQKKADHSAPNFKKYNAFLEKCVKKERKTFSECNRQAAGEFPPSAKTPVDWVAGKLSEMASDALKEIASALGAAVVWLLKKFAESFSALADIDLSKSGIGPILGITTGISALLATFLLLVQFGKLAVSQQGGPLVTAITGLAKWAVILGFYLIATQTVLDWSHTLSEALMDASFKGGGESMKERLGTLFAGLVGGGGAAAAGGGAVVGSGAAPAAVGFVIIFSVLVLLAIVALWVELLVRQAAIMLLIVAMPLVLAGQMADDTREWWPKARNALIAMILLDPIIAMTFSVGFTMVENAKGVQNLVVGLVIFTTAGVSWPFVAKFFIFSSAGAGGSAASGMISSLGNSVSSMFGGGQPALSGAGTAGGGSGYTRSLERENSRTADGDGGSSTDGGGGAAGGGFWSKAMMGRNGGSFMSKTKGAAGVGLQLAAVGKDMAESSFQNMAANAGLDHGAAGGRHSVVAPRGSLESLPERGSVPADPEASRPGIQPPPVAQEGSPPPSPSPKPNAGPPEGS